MTTSPVDLQPSIIRDPLVVAPMVTVREAIALMRSESTCASHRSAPERFPTLATTPVLFSSLKASKCVIVVEADQVIGVVTERDLVDFILSSPSTESINTLPIYQVIPQPVITLAASEYTTIYDAIKKMQRHHVEHLPLIDDQGTLLGLVTWDRLCHMFSPVELNRLTDVLEERVSAIEAENQRLQSSYAIELAKQVQTRTNALEIQLKRERLVTQMANRIRRSLNLHEILNACVQEVRSFLKCDRVLIFQVHPDGSGVVVSESVGEGWPVTRGKHIHDQCFLQHQNSLYSGECPIVINNIYEKNYSLCHIQLLEQYEVKANLVVPIHVSGQLWGVLFGHHCAKSREWQLDETQFLQEMAVQLAIAIQQSTTHQQLQVELIARQKAELKFRESQRRYANLVASAPVGIFYADTEGNYTYSNDQACAIAGLCFEEALGNGWSQALHPDDRDRVLKTWQIAVEKHKPYQLEYRFLHADGTVRWVYGQAVAERSADGQITGYVGTLTNINDRKQAEQALAALNAELEERVHQRTAELQEQQSFLQTVLDTFPLAVFWKDRQSRYLGCNRNFLKDAGIACVDDLVGKTDYDMPWSKTEANLYRKDDQEVMVSNQSKLGIIETQVPADGQQAWLETNKLPLHDLAGQVIGVLGTYQNISLRKQAEQMVNQQLAAIEAAIEGIAILKNDVYTYINKAHLNLLGYEKAEELLGKPWTMLYAPEDAIKFHQEIKPILERQRAWQGEAIAHCKDGSTLTLETSLTLTDDDLLICVCRDITERKQFEAERKQAQQQLTERNQQLAISNEELARATRLKDEFLANMSHELRTPLNAILGMAEGLQEEVFGALSDRQRKALATIERSGTHLLELINDILDMAKIEAGQMELDLKFMPIAPLCLSSLGFVKQQALKKNIQIETQLEPTLPDVFVDERRIRQVLINLLNNAVKFTPVDGHITLKVEWQRQDSASAETCQNFITIMVADTGIGIAPEDIDKLFQPFVQIDSTLNRQYNGTGLGLAMVKRIIELHQGDVRVTSKVGEGSCFAIQLPCTMCPLPGVPSLPTSNTDTPSCNAAEITSALILLAEENDATIATLSSYLGAKGYKLIVANSSQEMIALAQSEQPNLILMDVQISGMDGLKAIQHIRQDPSLMDLPIIAMTALAMEGDCEQCLAAGATAYIRKPIKLSNLVTLIRQHL